MDRPDAPALPDPAPPDPSRRQVIAIGGPDALEFLQNLVTNDVRPLAGGPGIVWAGLLTPQGKYLADFFLVRPPIAPPGFAAPPLLLDTAADLWPGLSARLSLYRLRAAVSFDDAGLSVHRGLGAPPLDGLADPRHPELGWRAWRTAPPPDDPVDWAALRVAATIPESGIELLPGETYPLEAGFERLNGVDFRKGCYVGQEVTARMKHKTDLRKGLVTLGIRGQAPVGAEIETGGRVIGRVFTQSGGRAIAHVRHDALAGDLTAGGARLFPL
jgi:tRNA-modifying protein YgfZ